MSHNDKRSPHTDALETLGTLIGPNEKRDAIHLAVYPVIAGEYLKVGEHVQLFETDGKAYSVNPGAEDDCGIVDPFLTANVHKGERFWLVVLPRTIKSLRHVWEHPLFPASTEQGENVTASSLVEAYTASIQAAAECAYAADPVRLTRLQATSSRVQSFIDGLEWDNPASTQDAYNERVRACNEAYAWIEAYALSLSGEYDDVDYTITADELIETANTHLPERNHRWGGDYIIKGGLLEGERTSVEFWDKFETLTGKRPAPKDSSDVWSHSPSFFSCSC